MRNLTPMVDGVDDGGKAGGVYGEDLVLPRAPSDPTTTAR